MCHLHGTVRNRWTLASIDLLSRLSRQMHRSMVAGKSHLSSPSSRRTDRLFLLLFRKATCVRSAERSQSINSRKSVFATFLKYLQVEPREILFYCFCLSFQPALSNKYVIFSSSGVTTIRTAFEEVIASRLGLFGEFAELQLSIDGIAALFMPGSTFLFLSTWVTCVQEAMATSVPRLDDAVRNELMVTGHRRFSHYFSKLMSDIDRRWGESWALVGWPENKRERTADSMEVIN